MTAKSNHEAATKTARVNQLEVVERLARLEAEELAQDTKLASMEKKLDSLIERFTRYEAKWGGIVMVLSALLGLAVALKSEIMKLFDVR